MLSTFRLTIPTHKIICFLHLDPGYGIYSYHHNYTVNGVHDTTNVNYKGTGGFYLGAGGGLRFKSRLSPYINVQYSLYRFKFQTSSTVLNQPEKDVFIADKGYDSGITVTAGIWLNTKQDKPVQ